MIKERKSNIELLRIIAMLLIISFHYVYKSNFTFESLNFNSFIVKSFYYFGELGTNIFVLITGYFMVKGKFSMKKLIKLMLEVNFYFVVSSVIAEILYGNISGILSFKSILWFFPIIFGKYWFVTGYVLIYIFSPFFNKLINSFSKEDFKKLLLVFLLLWSFIPTFFGVFNNGTEHYLFYSRFIWLIILYFIGAYIRLYSINFFKKKHRALLVAVVSFIVMELAIVVIFLFKDIFAKIGTTEVAYFWPPNSLPMLFLSVAVFYMFLNINIKKNRVINLFASTTLGIYMIHDGPLQYFLWHKWFRINHYLKTSIPICYILAGTIIIFVSCALIDIVRQFVEKYTIDKLLNSKLYTKAQEKCNKLYLKLCNLL